MAAHAPGRIEVVPLLAEPSESCNGTSPLPLPARSGQFHLLDEDELAHVPDSTWHVEGLVPEGGLTVVFGRSGVGKSFLVQDWALCTATGTGWHGHSVRSGPVVYVATEGGAGIPKRIKAWKHKRGAPALPGFYVVRETLHLLSPYTGWDDLRPGTAGDFITAVKARLGGRAPALLVLDTLAAALAEGDENTARDMSRACATLRHIQAELGECTVIVVHHTGKDGDEERGSYALRCAADASLKLEPDGKGVLLEGHKQRDWEAGEPIPLYLETVDLGGDQSSCVLARGVTPAAKLTGTARDALWALWTDFPEAEGATQTLWASASNLPKKTFARARKTLAQGGYVSDTEGRRGARYTLTERGRKALGVGAT